MDFKLTVVFRDRAIVEAVEAKLLPRPHEYDTCSEMAFDGVSTPRFIYHTDIDELASLILAFKPYQDRVIGFFVEAWNEVKTEQTRSVA